MSLTDALTGHAIRLSLTGSFEVRFAGDGPASFDDYEDLAGPDIGAILGKVGWRYGGAVTRVDAFPAAGPAQLPVASAWATPIVTPAGARGINISYGVGCSHRGNGLSALLSLVAVGECRAVQSLRFRPAPTRQRAGTLHQRALAGRRPGIGNRTGPGGSFRGADLQRKKSELRWVSRACGHLPEPRARAGNGAPLGLCARLAGCCCRLKRAT